VLGVSAFPQTGDGSVGERHLNLRWAALAIAGAFVLGVGLAAFPRKQSRRKGNVEVRIDE
jgi:hypothetical protein